MDGFAERTDAGGQQGGGRKAPHAPPGRQSRHDEDLGPAFPSEASGMDEVPF